MNNCYLCGKAITSNEAVTGDHVVPTVLLDKRQPKVRGFDYAGRIRTHQECNNHFSDENFFKQALHLVQLIISGEGPAALQNAAAPEISILPVTKDQIPTFVERDFHRFNFIDVRNSGTDQLKDPEFYKGKSKINLLKVSMHAAMTVMAKSAAALLVKRRLKRVPASWRIFASPFRSLDFPSFVARFGDTAPFDKHTRASLEEINQGEWLVAYQHKSILMLFLFVMHEGAVDPRAIFGFPEIEVHEFSGLSLNELLKVQWSVA